MWGRSKYVKKCCSDFQFLVKHRLAAFTVPKVLPLIISNETKMLIIDNKNHWKKSEQQEITSMTVTLSIGEWDKWEKRGGCTCAG